MAFQADFRSGVKDVVPLLLPLFAIGGATGIAATNAGLSSFQTLGMGVLFFSPISTVTTIELLESGAPAIVIVVTSISVVLHFAVLSLSIAPYFAQLSIKWKWVLAYFLNTPHYALSVKRYSADSETNIREYYLGVAVSGWLVWQASIIVGMLFGVGLPENLSVDFVIPLVFIALLVSMVKNRPTAAAAVSAGILSLLASTLPFSGGLILAAIIGIIAGMMVKTTEVTAQ
ncbi:AzlC family ABC transporter permease [Halogeometricum luteum]|uniref:AzlC family ABC transporter permease n=1 Tax=Halogeometricum luteum TaxID=2950537 RepID=A0ABU2G715_9EURY|nr:AzlC family ABC transporter permease [Halogeometricum sp. S3BR5-2]MDS0296572.1 AzlC family ABC transporter permease [Halogeometricum sp. S3BR5-2]